MKFQKNQAIFSIYTLNAFTKMFFKKVFLLLTQQDYNLKKRSTTFSIIASSFSDATQEW